MLTRNPIQRIQFVGMIVLGLVVFFYLLPWARDYSCVAPQQAVGTQNNDTGPDKHNNQSQTPANKPKNEDASSQSDNSDRSENEDWPKNILCGDMKLTDLALAFFTYTLAIVGWFTLRSNEQTAEAIERAYVFLGYNPLIFDDYRGVEFTLVMTNVGRMPAWIKEVGYAFLDRTDLPASREGIDWTWNKIPYDWIIGRVRRKIRKLESPYGWNHIFVTYISYQDVFTKRVHTSRMAMHICPDNAENERIARAGGDTWNEWD